MFKNKDSAEKVLTFPKRHYIKNEEVRTYRTYGIAEGDDTDRKIFVKIEPKVDNAEEIENILQ